MTGNCPQPGRAHLNPSGVLVKNDEPAPTDWQKIQMKVHQAKLREVLGHVERALAVAPFPDGMAGYDARLDLEKVQRRIASDIT